MCNSSGLRGGDIVIDLQIGCVAIINNSNMPEAMLGVMPPLENDFAIKSYFATGSVEENFATSITENCGKAMGHAGVWRQFVEEEVYCVGCSHFVTTWLDDSDGFKAGGRGG